MLVLSRKKGEKVLIGKDAQIQITLIGIKGDRVKLGFEAPTSIPIHREEVYDAIQRSQKRKD